MWSGQIVAILYSPSIMSVADESNTPTRDFSHAVASSFCRCNSSISRVTRPAASFEEYPRWMFRVPASAALAPRYADVSSAVRQMARIHQRSSQGSARRGREASGTQTGNSRVPKGMTRADVFNLLDEDQKTFS